MKYLNAAALTNCWIHYEHLCNLTYSEFRAFVKELQMVQQQFIISELNNESENSSEQESTMINNRLEELNDDISPKDDANPDNHEKPVENSKKNDFDLTVPYSRGFSTNKVSFAIFGTFRSKFVNDESQQYKRYVATCQSGFRVMGMVKPDHSVLLLSLLSCEGFREDMTLCRNTIMHYFKILEEAAEMKFDPTYSDMWSICQIARSIALKYLDINFKPLKLDYRDIQEEATEEVKDNSSFEKPEKKFKGYSLLDSELRQKQKKVRIQIVEHSIEEALSTFCKSHFHSVFVRNFHDPNIDADERYELCLEEAKERCKEWKNDKANDYGDLEFGKDTKEEVKVQPTSSEGATNFVPDEQDTDMQRANYLKLLNKIMQGESYGNNMIQKGKVISLMESIQHSKGIVIVGPRCSGKTTILKTFGQLLKQAETNVEMKISVLNPDVYSLEKLYGSSESGVMNPEISNNKDVRIASIASSVLNIALKGFENLQKPERVEENEDSVHGEVEKKLDDVSSVESRPGDNEEKPRLLKTLMFECANIDPIWADSLLDYIKQSNYVHDLFSPITSNDYTKIEFSRMVPLKFSNGATTKIPKDILMMFECDSLKDASPEFIKSVSLVNVEDKTLQWKDIFTREKNKLLSTLNQKPMLDFELSEHFDAIFKEFTVPFINKLLESRVKTFDFWQMKSLVIRMFKFLDGLLNNLLCIERELRAKDDPVYLPVKTKGQMVASNLGLMAVVWTFGGILNNEFRRRFEDTFVQFRRKFDLKLTGSLSSGSSSLNKSAKISLFEMYFDIERLQWDLVSERLSTRVNEGYQAKNSNIVIPSLEIAQGLLIFDTLMDRKNYNIQIEGKAASQKTTVLTNIAHKKRQAFRSIWIPMTASNTIDKSRKVYEQFYKTSENRFVMTPIDKKSPLFIVDDMHMENNYNTNFSEFFRMWDTYGGYYHLENGYFVNVEQLRVMCSTNPSFKSSTNSKNERFTYYTNTIYFDELDNDRFRMFVQNWLTNKSWNTSKLVNKFYILITNSLMSIKEKIQKNDKFSETQRLKLWNFHHFTRFLSNFSTFTLMLNEDATANEKEEEVIAHLLAYELSTTFGDRIMFPTIKNEFMAKVQEVCKHNFLIPTITPEKIRGYTYGNFHELHKQPSSFVYSKHYAPDFKTMALQLSKKLKLDSENSCGYLQAYLEAPGVLKNIYKIARLIVTKNSHMCLIGPPRA